MVDSELIDQLKRGEHDPAALSDLKEAIQCGRLAPTQIVSELAGGKTTYNTLLSTMSALESVANLDPPLALMLMTSLYELADNAFEHDICDAIDLWIDSEGNAEFADFLRFQLASSGACAMRKKLTEWLALVDQRA